MNANGIECATKALRNRLAAALGKTGDSGAVFVGPLDDADATSAQLTLFLYRVVPSPTLRNREHRVPLATPPHVAVFQNALPLDLYYLLTVGKISGGSEEMPLWWLGQAMQALQANPSLMGVDMNYETAQVTPEPLTTEEASRIWTLFPTANFRTSVAYLVSPVWIDPLQPTPEAERVTQDEFLAGVKPEVVKE